MVSMNEVTTSNKQVALDILSQLGGRQFLAMTGCKNLVYDHNSLTMKLIPNRTKAKYLKITVNGLDLYDVKFMTASRTTGEISIKREIVNLGCENLREVFESETGLYTKLFK